jgi:AhpD family alkylhydroperoxidase
VKAEFEDVASLLAANLKQCKETLNSHSLAATAAGLVAAYAATAAIAFHIV